MQTMANIIQRPIEVASSDQTCALGAAMMAAVVGNIYESVEEAMQRMGQGSDKTYEPDTLLKAYYDERFAAYTELGHQLYNNG